MGYIKKYPALPTLYSQITAALESGASTIDSLAALVAQEPAINARLLQMVNSPSIGLRQRVTSVSDAMSFLGFQRLRTLVLATSLFGQFDVSKCRTFDPAEFEKRSLQVATWATRIARAETRG